MAALESFSDFIKVPLKCFGVIGWKPYQQEPIKPETRKEKFLKAYFCFNVTSVVVGAALFIVSLKVNFESIEKLTKTIPPWGYTFMALSKSLCIFVNKEKFKEIIETLDELFPRTKKEQALFKPKKYLKSYKLVEKALLAPVIASAISMIAINFIKLVFFGIWYEDLPFENWYPFDEYHPVTYNFVFLWQNVNATITVSCLLGADLIFYLLITLLSMQFDILCYKVQKLSTKDDFKDFKILLEFHDKLLKLSKSLEEIFSPSILFNFIASSILICLVGFQVSVKIDFNIYIRSALMLTVGLIQIFILCHYGNKLTTTAENVATSIYNCDWLDNRGGKLKAAMLMMTQRSQKKTALTAFKFSTLDLEAFTVVRIVFLLEINSFTENMTGLGIFVLLLHIAPIPQRKLDAMNFIQAKLHKQKK
jgi:odorant receptor